MQENSTPQWLNELNLDPRNRIAAEAGGDLVQKYQDEFIQQAWQQVGELKAANKLLRGAQMACMIGRRLKNPHFNPLNADQLLQVSGPAQQRISLGSVYKLKLEVYNNLIQIYLSDAFAYTSPSASPLVDIRDSSHRS